MHTTGTLFLLLAAAALAALAARPPAPAATDSSAQATAKRACLALADAYLNTTLTGIDEQIKRHPRELYAVLTFAVNATRCTGSQYDLLYGLTATLCAPEHDYLVSCQLDRLVDESLVLLVQVPGPEREVAGKCGCQARDAEAALAADRAAKAAAEKTGTAAATTSTGKA